MATKPRPLIVIVGQTGSGKSALAMKLAQKFDGEIIAADARTVYKGMDIGTAKPVADDRARIRHHLLDLLTPDQRFTAADFKQLANEAIEDISSRGKLPIMVGGTGLYVDAVLYNYSFADANAARDSQNPRHLSKAAMSKREELRPNTLIIGLEVDKEELTKRITTRVTEMLEQGLRQEVKRLVKAYGWEAPGLNAIGYREWQSLFNDPSISEGEVEAAIIRDTLSYAKRQKTWFRSPRYDKPPDSGKPFLAKSAPDSLDVPMGMPQSPEADLPQKSSRLNKSANRNEGTERNKSIQWAADPRQAVEIATTFLYKS